MSRVSMREWRRREQLRTKGKVDKFSVNSVVAGIGLSILFLSLALSSFPVQYTDTPVVQVAGVQEDRQDSMEFSVFIGVVGLLLFYVSLQHGMKDMQATPRRHHVPAIKPEVSAQRRELLRSAEAPSAASETLLRATVTGEEAKPEELLRVAAGATREQD